MAIKDSLNGISWIEWPKELKNREKDALAEAREKSVESYQNNMIEMRTLMEDYGMEFLELDDSVVSYLKDSAQNSYQMLADGIGSEWLDSLFAALDEEK